MATFFVMWAQPLWEQMFGAGEGNLSRLASGAGSSGLRISWRLALRIVASVVGRAPWTARSGLENAVPNTPYSSPGVLGAVHNLSGWAAAARLVLLVAILVAAVWLAWRRRDRRALAMMVVGIGGLLIAAATLLVMPIGPFGLTAHQMRWLWSLTAYLWFAVLMTFAGLAAERFSLKVTAAFVAVLALLAAATVPTFVQPLGPAGRAVEGPVVAELDRQMSKLQGIGTVLFDTRNTPVLDNYSAAVMAELQQLAIPFKVDDEGLVRQLGDRRRYLDDADVRMYLLYGKDALTVPAGDDRVALATPLNGAEQSELQALMTADPTAAEPSSRYTELLDMVYAGTTVAVIIAPL
ncbi:MAG: hypothetical protein ABIQ39_09255 [Ilumatobacteraceae bacterium]